MKVYQQLLKKGRRYDLSTEQSIIHEKIAYYLEQLNKESQEQCLMLILKNFHDSTGSVKLQQIALPFKGHTMLKSSGAKFTVSNLPEDLVRILMAFIEHGTNKSLFRKITAKK